MKKGNYSTGFNGFKDLDEDRVDDLTDDLYTYVNGERVGIGLYKQRLVNHTPGYTKEFFIPWYERVFGYTPKEI